MHLIKNSHYSLHAEKSIIYLVCHIRSKKIEMDVDV
jgi:hypothetical protein